MKMDDALKIAVEEFRKFRSESTSREVKYLSRRYLVSPDTAEVTYLEDKGQVSQREKIIILHYLTGTHKDAITGKLIDFREVPGGRVYYSVFEKRVCQPFLGIFAGEHALFTKAAEVLDGERIDFGDVGFRFTVLPEVAVSFILYQGDEEFPPTCKVLFDSSITQYLPTEDIVALCEDTVKELRINSALTT
jgi:hypothetical protein